MKNGYWIAVAVGTLVVGLLVGYGIWGLTASELPGVERELAAAQAQIGDLKKKVADMEANLGRVTNEKLTLEKEIAEVKESLEKATKKRR